MMQRGDVLILDVRTQEEFDEGHIEGAILIPEYALQERAQEVISSISQTVLVYCRSGRRSGIAASILTEMGFLHVYDFGGILSWPYEILR